MLMAANFKIALFSVMSYFRRKLWRKSDVMHNKRSGPGNRAWRWWIRGSQILINSHVCLLWYCWVQVTPCLCSRHVLPRCFAMLNATGCSLETPIVFWPTGLVDNLHPIATECDSTGVSTGFWIHRFIASHTDRVRWCISKKFTKESLKFRAGMLGFATSRAESFVFRSYWFIF